MDVIVMTHMLRLCVAVPHSPLSGAIVCDSLMNAVYACSRPDFRWSEARAPGKAQREVCGTIQPSLYVLWL